MKILIISIIALVIPLFFLFIFGSSLHSKLTQMRNRCRLAGERAEAIAGDASVPDERKAAALAEFSQATEAYNAARSASAARVVSALFGFQEAALPSIPSRRSE